MDEEPERLAEIKGISMAKARKIAESYSMNRKFQEVIIFLAQYNISINLAMKIYNEYGDTIYSVIANNPYKIAEDIPGVGFKTADDIARKVGIPDDSEFRIRSAILYALGQAMSMGHMYLPRNILVNEVRGLLNLYVDIPDDIIHDQIEVLHVEREIFVEMNTAEDNEEEPAVYTTYNYYIEKNSARMITDLRVSYEIADDEFEKALNRVENYQKIKFDDKQVEAIKSAVCNGVAVVTGGPGTGKTTITKAIIEYFIYSGMTVKLAAPTGRAAKRITEATGYKAVTVHRLLEFVGEPGEAENTKGLKFGRNRENPIEADAILVDEASMLDSILFCSLLAAIDDGTRLILIGDTDQLPPVGAGNVLRDIIDSG